MEETSQAIRHMRLKIKINTKAEYKTTAWAWFICGIGALFYTYEYFLRIEPSVITADLMRHFHIHAAALGGLSAFYYYAYMPMQLPVGLLMDLYGPRRLLTFACALCVAGTYLFICSDIYAVAAFGRFLVGFGSAFAFVGVLKLATIWLPPDKIAMVSGMAAALGTVGAMIGDVTLTRLVDKLGWLDSVYLSALCGIGLIFVIWVFVRDKPPMSAAPPQNNHYRESLRDLVIIMKNPQIWFNGLIGCFLYLPTTAFAELWGIPYLEQAYSLKPQDAAVAISAIFLGFTIGAPLSGMISDKLKLRRLPLFIGAIGAATLFTLLVYMPGIPKWGLYTLLFFIGAMYSTQVIVFAIGREISPASASGTAIAATNMLVMLGGVVFQPVIGILLEYKWAGGFIQGIHFYSAEEFQFALAVIPIGIVIAAVLTLFLKETHCKVLDES